MTAVLVVPLDAVVAVEVDADAAVAVTLSDAPTLTTTVVGYPGPAGRDGAAAGAYTHTQSAPSATWTMNHNLGYRPSCTLFTVGGVEFEGQVTHTSVNQAVATFEAAIAGTARFI